MLHVPRQSIIPSSSQTLLHAGFTSNLSFTFAPEWHTYNTFTFQFRYSWQRSNNVKQRKWCFQSVRPSSKQDINTILIPYSFIKKDLRVYLVSREVRCIITKASLRDVRVEIAPEFNRVIVGSYRITSSSIKRLTVLNQTEQIGTVTNQRQGTLRLCLLSRWVGLYIV